MYPKSNRMTRFWDWIESSHFGALYLSIILFLAASTLTRVALTVLHFGQIKADWLALVPAYLGGFLFDGISALYLAIPFAIFLLIVPPKWFRWRPVRWLTYVVFFAHLYALLYLSIAELYFFDEFNSRFNYVAVDYLFFPHEVFVNLWETYPVGKALIAVGIASLALFWWARPHLSASLQRPVDWRTRARFSVAYALPLIAAGLWVNVNSLRPSDNRVLNEIGANGVYSFFYAATTNEMDYDSYYATTDDRTAFARARELIRTPDSTFTDPANPYSLDRTVRGSDHAKPMNVVIILEESLGSNFLHSLHPEGPSVAPELDRIASEGLFFTHIYATGNRTVRGIEATLTSFPPIPGQSIVKRPDGAHVFSLPQLLKDKGYQTAFIYGGRSYFDNMKSFAESNGFERVIDQSDFKKETFSTIWGVCDEDLFDNALPELDRMAATGKPFFSLILTVSNHAPFEYPAGRIPGDPKEHRREYGVRYADFALGKFIHEAKSHAFFDNSLFVILGDHGARVYGHQEIPMDSYEIPVVFYAPKLFPVGVRNDTLASQMDVAPTIMGVLGFEYNSQFFGRDIRKIPPDRQWALLSHNRDVALFRDGKLGVLGLLGEKQLWSRDPKTGEFTKLDPKTDPQLVDDAIAYYQTGYRFFKTHRFHPLAQVPVDASRRLATATDVAR